ncbi:hypothetical protein ABG067_001939 [Albugo candida]
MENKDRAQPANSKTQLTLEEKLWFQRRRQDLQQFSTVGGAVGAVLGTAITILGPFKRRVQIATILGTTIIGAGSGYLFADTKAFDRITDLSAQSQLRKQYNQLYVLTSRFSQICA